MGYLTEINQLQLKLHIIHKTKFTRPNMSETMQINLKASEQPRSEAEGFLDSQSSDSHLDINDLYSDKWG